MLIERPKQVSKLLRNILKGRKMRALFTKRPEHIDDVQEFLNENNIECREFEDETGNVEIRVDLSDVEQKQLDLFE